MNLISDQDLDFKGSCLDTDSIQICIMTWKKVNFVPLT